jgi:M6 family metalloprotease-like protein
MWASRFLSVCLSLVGAAWSAEAAAQAPLPPAVRVCENPNLEMFGYNERARTGQRPLIVVLIDFTDAELNPQRNAAYFDNLIFAAPEPYRPTVAGMFRGASNGRFSFSKATIVQVAWPAAGGDLPEDFDAQVTRLMAEALRRNGPSLESFDRNRDRIVDDSEVAILRISNSPVFRGGAQSRTHDTQFGAGYWWRGWTANVDEEVDLNTIAHELFHALGFPDHIYGPGGALNRRASFMAASYGTSQTPGPIPLDPHHRMRAGWLRPRLMNMSSAGAARLALYGSGESEALLFYTPERCASEFFVADFHRVMHLPQSAYDGGAFGTGVYLWYVKPAPGGHVPFQFNWPPPIRRAFIDNGTPTHAIANYIVSPRGPGESAALEYNTPEFVPAWGDGTPTGIGFEWGAERFADFGYLGWRRTPGRYLARIDTINGGRAAATIANQPGSEIVLTGVFPARADGIRAELINLSGRIRVPMTYAGDRVTLRLSAPVPAGAYQVHLVRDAPREILMRGPQIVNIR